VFHFLLETVHVEREVSSGTGADADVETTTERTETRNNIDAIDGIGQKDIWADIGEAEEASGSLGGERLARGANSAIKRTVLHTREWIVLVKDGAGATGSCSVVTETRYGAIPSLAAFAP
jgi:hypothetical protein